MKFRTDSFTNYPLGLSKFVSQNSYRIINSISKDILHILSHKISIRAAVFMIKCL